MKAWILLELDGREVRVTEHALKRWQEYVCPLRPRRWSLDLLELVVRLVGEPAAEPPDWLILDRPQDGQRYLLAGDFALVLMDTGGWTYVVTVIARGGLPPRARAARNSAAAARRASRTARRRQASRVDRESRSRRRELRAPVADDLDAYTRRIQPRS